MSKQFWYIIGGAFLLSLLSKKNGEPMQTKYPNPGARSRGLKNNNPGNIKETGTNWQGQLKPSGDPPFAQFQEMVWGARAMIILIKRTYRNQGIKTIRTIINRYAPPVENWTDAYIEAVSRRTGINPDAVLSSEDDYKRVIQAMAIHETGAADALPNSLYFEANALI